MTFRIPSPKIQMQLLKSPASKPSGPCVIEKASYIRLSFRKGGQPEVCMYVCMYSGASLQGMGLEERLSSSQRYQVVLCLEVVLFSVCPLSEVPLSVIALCLCTTIFYGTFCSKLTRTFYSKLTHTFYSKLTHTFYSKLTHTFYSKLTHTFKRSFYS